MPLVTLSSPPRQTDVRWMLILVSVAPASFGLMTLARGPGAASLFTGCLFVPVIWIWLVARSRMVLLDIERKKIIVRWRNAIFVQREVELPLGRFEYVVSYYPFFGKNPRNYVALVERATNRGFRGLHVAGFPASYQRNGFWRGMDLVEVEAAKNLRASLSRQLGIPDGGYRGMRFPILQPSEKAI